MLSKENLHKHENANVRITQDLPVDLKISSPCISYLNGSGKTSFSNSFTSYPLFEAKCDNSHLAFLRDIVI
jgi:hypothetical protein